MDTPTIALVAGEASGDQLGAALIRSLKQRFPAARFCGVGGAAMRAAGMDTWWDCEELALFGLFEVLGHLPRLIALRRALRRRLLAERPAVYVGIDAPDFNLGLEAQLRRNGIRTVHYVSPTVWAWRPGRVRKIARAADRVLCLFPFEPAFYAGHGVAATYVGHPLADQIAPVPDTAAARQRLQLEGAGQVVALLPGSRVSEVVRLAAPMIAAALRLADRNPGLRAIAAIANDRVEEVFQDALERSGPGARALIRPFQGETRTVIAAADVVLCACGTATLETMLVNRPMVTAYRLAPATYHAAKHLRIVRRQFFALPNILAGRALVPELIQEEVTPEQLAREAQRWLGDDHARELLAARFEALGRELRCDASERAADAVAALLQENA